MAKLLSKDAAINSGVPSGHDPSSVSAPEASPAKPSSSFFQATMDRVRMKTPQWEFEAVNVPAWLAAFTIIVLATMIWSGVWVSF